MHEYKGRLRLQEEDKLELHTRIAELTLIIPDDERDEKGSINLETIAPDPEEPNYGELFCNALIEMDEYDGNNAVWDADGEGPPILIHPPTEFYVYPKTAQILKSLGIPFIQLPFADPNFPY